MEDIFLWGLQGAGKTWLLHALIRCINLEEEDLRKQNSPFEIRIDDIYNHRVSRLELENLGTLDVNYSIYTLKRKFNIEENQSEKQNLIHIACTNNHEISLLDGPGNAVTGELLIDNDNEENRAKVLSAYERLKSSKYLIIVVNNGSLSISESIRPAGKVFSESLQHLITMDRNIEQKVYLCFSKIDKYGEMSPSMESLLIKYFGNYADHIKAQLYELFPEKPDTLPIYFVSSSGYYYNEKSEIVPNFNNEVLADSSSWKPQNVKDLFYDIFDYSEKKLINEKSIESPIKNWPLPNKLHRIIDQYLISNHKRDILNSYISYHDMKMYKKRK